MIDYFNQLKSIAESEGIREDVKVQIISDIDKFKTQMIIKEAGDCKKAFAINHVADFFDDYKKMVLVMNKYEYMNGTNEFRKFFNVAELYIMTELLD